MATRVLIVDDDDDMRALLEDALARQGYRTLGASTADAAFEIVLQGAVDVVVTDLRMRGMDGIELTTRVVASRPDVPVIVITGFGSLDTAIATLRAGATDFLTKPFEPDDLVIALERAGKQRSLRREIERLEGLVEGAGRFDEILGASPAMQRVFDLLARTVDFDGAVLVTGESGTGKELVAKALHTRSRRKDGPFIAVNCAALPETLLESELFGHVKGAFTDARAPKRGLFVEASGGTLFLDEIGEIPLGMQAKLLRALETRSVRPLGSTSEIPFDVKLVSATNRDLESRVADKQFREDLFYRVNVLHVELPPLRARGSDVLLLAASFLERFAKRAGKPAKTLSAAATEKLLGYAWPGNVRELSNCIERALALSRGPEILPEDLPERVTAYKAAPLYLGVDDPAELVRLEVIEKRYILRVLEAVNGNKSTAAKVLGLDRKTLYRRLEAWGIRGDDG
jgi:two-component system response regulator HydG